MTSYNIKPTIPTKRPSFNGGLVPGSLRGNRMELTPPVDPDEEIRDLTASMTGPQLRAWLKQGDNRKTYDEFLERRKNNDY
jgi:hypothetical protein